MRNRFRASCQAQATTVALLAAMLLYKVMLDISYWRFLTADAVTYRADFSPLKYGLGLLCCLALFAGIRHTARKASGFCLYLVLLLQFIPITTIYALGNDSTEYYLVLFVSLLLCELAVGYVDSGKLLRQSIPLSYMAVGGCLVLVLLVLALVVRSNGVPSLTALNIYKVYDLRRSGAFHLGKMAGYLFSATTKILIPFFLAWCLWKKQYIGALALCGVMLLFYLYSGHKTMLFAIPLVVAVSFWARREHCYRELFICLCVGTALLIAAYLVFPAQEGIFYKIYSLFCRRTLIVTANNKFKYFDFFSTYPKMGLGGVYPRWLVPMQNPYEYAAYPNFISDIYYGKPDMTSNTGFLAEGFARFGHVGTVMILLIFAWLLKLADRMQERVGYGLTVSIMVYPVFALGDMYLLSSLLCGEWTVLLLILLLYTQRPPQRKLLSRPATVNT